MIVIAQHKSIQETGMLPGILTQSASGVSDW